jgi:outer membrane protein assembly factor BamA
VAKLPIRPLLRTLLVACLLVAPCVALGSDSFNLSLVQLVGTTRLSADDVARGLGLQVGEAITPRNLLLSCDHLIRLKLFGSTRCFYRIARGNVSLTISVKDTPGAMPVVFDNFVWMTRAELLARLKQQLPLFMAELPASSGLTNDIIRLLENVAAEHGIKARVRYDDTFWTERGMNVFFLEGISTPITSLQIEGENAPAPEELHKWAQFYREENFSAARLTWVIRWVIRDFYFSRGHMRPVVGRPIVLCLGGKDGAYLVRVIIPIMPGDIYTYESVKFEGLAEARKSLLLQEWKLKPGDPYDDSYTQSFIFRKILSAPRAQHSKAESRTALTCAKVDEAGRKVHVIINVEAPKRTSPVLRVDDCGGVSKFLVSPAVP